MAGNSQVSLTWDISAGAYQLQPLRSVNGGAYSQLTAVHHHHELYGYRAHQWYAILLRGDCPEFLRRECQVHFGPAPHPNNLHHRRPWL